MPACWQWRVRIAPALLADPALLLSRAAAKRCGCALRSNGPRPCSCHTLRATIYLRPKERASALSACATHLGACTAAAIDNPTPCLWQGRGSCTGCVVCAMVGTTQGAHAWPGLARWRCVSGAPCSALLADHKVHCQLRHALSKQANSMVAGAVAMLKLRTHTSPHTQLWPAATRCHQAKPHHTSHTDHRCIVSPMWAHNHP